MKIIWDWRRMLTLAVWYNWECVCLMNMATYQDKNFVGSSISSFKVKSNKYPHLLLIFSKKLESISKSFVHKASVTRHSLINLSNLDFFWIRKINGLCFMVGMTFRICSSWSVTNLHPNQVRIFTNQSRFTSH